MNRADWTESRCEASRVTHRVLIADDQESWIQRITNLLVPAGYQVEGIRDSRDVLSKLASDSFDLLILDTMMPYLDGLQVLNAVKQDPRLQQLPVIMLPVGLALVDDQRRMLARLQDLGAAECLVKDRLGDASILAAVRRILPGDAGSNQP